MLRPLDDRSVSLLRRPPLSEMYVLSPYVYLDEGELHVMVRAVPRLDERPRDKIASIYHGKGRNELEFVMDDEPTIAPGPDIDDEGGCEDPTVIRDGAALYVFYTGYNRLAERGLLMLASGPDSHSLHKRGVIFDEPRFHNAKEATLVPARAGWHIFFEYAANDASLIGAARAASLEGPWDFVPFPLAPRPQSWDSWHLSTGPVVGGATGRPMMLYNGATRDARWRIGWAVFDADFTRVVDRCEQPLLSPPAVRPEGWSDIAFAASAIESSDRIDLYYSVADQDVRRAVLTYDE